MLERSLGHLKLLAEFEGLSTSFLIIGQSKHKKMYHRFEILMDLLKKGTNKKTFAIL